MTTDLHAALQQLAAFPATEHPFLSIYADWSQIDNGSRPAIRQIETELQRIAGELNLHGDAREHLEADLQRISEYLNRDAPADASALAIFACGAENAWMAIPLHAPVQTYVAADRFPHMFQLAQVAEDYETFALVVAEGQEARIFVISHNEPEHVGGTEAGEKIKRFDQGGQAQMLFQRRTANVIKAHIKDLGQELGTVIDRYNVEHVILSSNDSIKGIVLDTLPQQIQAKMVDYITLDPNAGMETIMQTITPIMERVEREQEQQVATDLANEVGANARGMAGIADTAMALSKGQVRVLVMHRGFAAEGRTNPSSGFLFAPGYLNDPYDGSELVPVDLREAFVARAFQQGATVEIVESSEYLDQHEGVGALLHYRDDQSAIEAGSR